jgi:hypothetical protein
MFDPPRGSKIIYLYYDQSDAEAYQSALRMIQSHGWSLAQQDTIAGLLETSLFPLSPGYDMMIRLTLQDRKIQLRGYCFNYLGMEFEAECGALMRGPLLAFNRLNAFAYSLRGRLNTMRFAYAKE